MSRRRSFSPTWLALRLQALRRDRDRARLGRKSIRLSGCAGAAESSAGGSRLFFLGGKKGVRIDGKGRRGEGGKWGSGTMASGRKAPRRTGRCCDASRRAKSDSMQDGDLPSQEEVRLMLEKAGMRFFSAPPACALLMLSRGCHHFQCGGTGLSISNTWPACGAWGMQVAEHKATARRGASLHPTLCRGFGLAQGQPVIWWRCRAFVTCGLWGLQGPGMVEEVGDL